MLRYPVIYQLPSACLARARVRKPSNSTPYIPTSVTPRSNRSSRELSSFSPPQRPLLSILHLSSLTHLAQRKRIDTRFTPGPKRRSRRALLAHRALRPPKAPRRVRLPLPRDHEATLTDTPAQRLTVHSAIPPGTARTYGAARPARAANIVRHRRRGAEPARRAAVALVVDQHDHPHANGARVPQQRRAVDPARAALLAGVDVWEPGCGRR